MSKKAIILISFFVLLSAGFLTYAGYSILREKQAPSLEKINCLTWGRRDIPSPDFPLPTRIAT